MEFSYMIEQPQLSDLCIQTLLQNPEVWLISDGDTSSWNLRPEVFLTRVISEQMLRQWSRQHHFNNAIQKNNPYKGENVIDDNLEERVVHIDLASVFANIHHASLCCIDLGWAEISADSLGGLLAHQPRYLYIRNAVPSDCCSSSKKDLVPSEYLRRIARQAIVLELGTNAGLLAAPTEDLSFPSLRVLSAHGLLYSNAVDLGLRAFNQLPVDRLLYCCQTLTVLDLSESTFLASQARKALLKLSPTLECLSLHRCKWFFAADTMALPELKSSMDTVMYDVTSSGLAVLQQLVGLRHLDISMPERFENFSCFKDPEESLRELVSHLNRLESLDISYTNLCGYLSAEGCNRVKFAIPGLDCRQDRPLSFLGLYGCPYDACTRSDLPAIRVAGSASLDQFMVALRNWLDRPVGLHMVLDDLFQAVRHMDAGVSDIPLEEVPTVQLLELTDLISYCLLKFWKDQTGTTGYASHLQISGSAVLYYLIKVLMETERLHSVGLTIQRVNRLLSCILNALHNFPDEPTIARNNLLSLGKFGMTPSASSQPATVQSALQQHIATLTRVLLQLLGCRPNGLNMGSIRQVQDEFVERLTLLQLNTLCISAQGKQKAVMGVTWGVVESMLQVIRAYIAREQTDERLNLAWSTLWNITDETPENSDAFLRYDGLVAFHLCYKECSRDGADEEMRRNMMGLLGNVAEVSCLRDQLRADDKLLSLLVDLVGQWREDNVETAYNAGGVLAHLLKDGRGNTDKECEWQANAAAVLIYNTSQWKLDVERQINYHSFLPILSLLDATHTPACQFWALWALTNLSHRNPERYVKLLLEEGAPAKLEAYLAVNSTVLGVCPMGSGAASSSSSQKSVCTRLPCQWARRTLGLLREWVPDGQHRPAAGDH